MADITRLLDAAAEERLRAALDLRRRTLPANDPATLNALNSLAVLLLNRGKAEEAIPLYLEAVAGRTTVLGPDHLVRLYKAWGKPAQADEWRRRHDARTRPGSDK